MRKQVWKGQKNTLRLLFIDVFFKGWLPLLLGFTAISSLTFFSSLHFHFRFKHTWRVYLECITQVTGHVEPPGRLSTQHPFSHATWLSLQLFCLRLNFSKPQPWIFNRKCLHYFQPYWPLPTWDY